MKLHPGSLRARLWRIGAIGMVLASAAASWGLGEAFARATLASFDSRLSEDLLTLSGLVERGPDEQLVMSREPTDDRYHRALSGHYWLVIQGSERFRSRSLWDVELALPEFAAGGAMQFVTTTGPLQQQLRAAAQNVRIAGLRAPVTLVAASDATETYARIREFRWYGGLSAAAMVVLLLAMIAYQVNYGLKPLRGIATTLARVRAGEHRRLDPEVMPEEVRPLATSLNELLDHQTRMIARGRNAASDLAHALKTPLAVLAAAAQQRPHDLSESVLAQVERMRASIDHQLAIAVVGDARSRTPVAEVAEQLAGLMRQVHGRKPLEIVVAVAPEAVFQGERVDLEEMLGNLLDNACKWATARVTLDCSVRDRRLHLLIEDDGPGMDSAAARAALRRGIRLDERVAGSGLGLAIALDLAESYGGELRLDRSSAGGLAARLELPAG